MKSLRIVVTVSDGNPELYASLDGIPSRLRAERVRALATIGVAVAVRGLGISPRTPDDQTKTTAETKPAQEVTTASLDKAIRAAGRLGLKP